MFSTQFSEIIKLNNAGELIILQQVKIRKLFGIRISKYTYMKEVDDTEVLGTLPSKSQVIGFVAPSMINTRGVEEQNEESKKLTKPIRKTLGR